MLNSLLPSIGRIPSSRGRILFPSTLAPTRATGKRPIAATASKSAAGETRYRRATPTRSRKMMLSRSGVVSTILSVLLIASPLTAQGPQPSATPSPAENKELIAAALKLTKEAAEKYAFVLDDAASQPPQ